MRTHDVTVEPKTGALLVPHLFRTVAAATIIGDAAGLSVAIDSAGEQTRVSVRGSAALRRPVLVRLAILG